MSDQFEIYVQLAEDESNPTWIRAGHYEQGTKDKEIIADIEQTLSLR
jgi:hypothetical protein